MGPEQQRLEKDSFIHYWWN